MTIVIWTQRPWDQQLRKQKVETALKAQKQDQIYESPFDPDLVYVACVKKQGSTGDGTVTDEDSELLCL